MEKPRKNLLPCPFCGGDAQVGRDIHNTSYKVYCKNSCPVRPWTYNWRYSENESVDDWNTRAMSTWLEGQVPTGSELVKIIEDELQTDCLKALLDIGENPNYYEATQVLARSIHALITRKMTGKV